MAEQAGNPDQDYWTGLARAFGGAVIFGLPLLMTMEMWWLGFYIDRLRLALLLGFTVPLLVGLSYHAGFRETIEWKEQVLDALTGLAVGYVSAAVVLFLLAVVGPEMDAGEIVGKISLQAIPASMGAMLARSQLGEQKPQEREQRPATRYLGELFLMVAGALFLAFNLAPTEEMVLIAYMMTEWHAIVLVLLSLLIMHAFVYILEFEGQNSIPPGTSAWSLFLRYTVVGYALVLLVSLYMLWSFERTTDVAAAQILVTTVVLAFPGAVGAAAARLIL